MITDSEFVRQAEAVVSFSRKLESLRQEGRLNQRLYAEKRQHLLSKLAELRGKNAELLELEALKIDQGFDRLEELSTGGLLSHEKYNSLVAEQSQQKNGFLAEKDALGGMSDEAYLDCLVQQIDASARKLEPEKKPVKSLGQYAASMDVSFMILSVVAFCILLASIAVISSILMPYFSTSKVRGAALTTVRSGDGGVPFVTTSTSTVSHLSGSSSTLPASTSTSVQASTTLSTSIALVEAAKYARVCCLKVLDGKLAYIAEDAGESFVVLGGEEDRRAYDRVESLAVSGGSLAYLAQKAGKSFVVFDGAELGREYDAVLEFAFVGDSIAYVAEEGGSRFIVFDGEEIGRLGGYSDVFNLTDVSGKPAFIAEKGGASVVVYDGREIRGNYDFVVPGSPAAVDGKLAFEVQSGEKHSVIFDGSDVGEQYSRASNPVDAGGKLAFIGTDAGRDFVVYDGKKVGEAYDHIVPGSLKVFDGRIVFVARKYYVPAVRRDQEFVVYKEKKISQDYDSIVPDSISEIDGKVTYVAVKEGKNILVSNGDEVKTSYDSISSYANIGGSLAFVASKGSEHVIFYRGTELGGGRGYSKIAEATDADGKLAFIASTDGGSFVVVERYYPLRYFTAI